MSFSQPLIERIDYRQKALNRERLSGFLELANLPRTADIVVPDSSSTVEVSIALEEDAQRRIKLSGRLQTTLVLACQRCLKATDQPIDAAIGGIVVASDEAAAQVPREAEPILAVSDWLNLHALIDDELLLAVPMTVQCDRLDCRAAYDLESRASASEPTPDKPNPFAALASLKRDDDEPH